MNDKLRLLIMAVIEAGIVLVVALGIAVEAELKVAIVGFSNAVLFLVMYFWKNGQQPG